MHGISRFFSPREEDKPISCAESVAVKLNTSNKERGGEIETYKVARQQLSIWGAVTQRGEQMDQWLPALSAGGII